MYTFFNKWADIRKGALGADESSLFVDVGQKPVTQRQINLYCEFLLFSDVLNMAEAKEVLEVGCGRGTLSLYLAKHADFHLSLLDNEKDAIEIARGEFQKHGRRAKFYTEDALNNTIPNQSFDATVSIGLAEHFSTPQDVKKLFREQYRLLRKGGVMVSINIPKKFSVQSLNTIMRMIKKIFGAYSGDIHSDYYRNTFTSREYKEMAQCAGFKNIKIIHACPFPIYTPIVSSTDRKVAAFNRFVLKVRSLFQKHPYVTNKFIAQEHFLVGYK